MPITFKLYVKRNICILYKCLSHYLIASQGFCGLGSKYLTLSARAGEFLTFFSFELAPWALRMQKKDTYTHEWTRLNALGIQGEHASCRSEFALSPVQLYSSSSCNSPIQSLPLLQRNETNTFQSEHLCLACLLGALGTALVPVFQAASQITSSAFKDTSLTASVRCGALQIQFWKRQTCSKTSTKNGTRLMTLWDPYAVFPWSPTPTSPNPPFLHSTEEGSHGENWDQLLRWHQVRNL